MLSVAFYLYHASLVIMEIIQLYSHSNWDRKHLGGLIVCQWMDEKDQVRGQNCELQ